MGISSLGYPVGRSRALRNLQLFWLPLLLLEHRQGLAILFCLGNGHKGYVGVVFGDGGANLVQRNAEEFTAQVDHVHPPAGEVAMQHVLKSWRVLTVDHGVYIEGEWD